jgi:hypothetical protein
MAARTLRRLYDAHYLSVAAPRLDGANVYSLGKRGRIWCLDRGLAPGRVPRALPHHLALVTTWTAIAAAVRDAGWRLKFTPSWELPSQVAIPDALFEVAIPFSRGPHHLRCVLEVDCGTEASSVLRLKVERLALLASAEGLGTGWSDPMLAFALFNASPKRIEAVRGMIDAVWLGRSVVWTAEVGPGGALRDLYQEVATARCTGCNPQQHASDGSALHYDAVSVGYSETENDDHGL